MANQFNHARNWGLELRKNAAKLQLCIVLPDRLTANTRVRSICLHGVESNTTVYRLCERQYCCKSQASKAHDVEQKRIAAVKSWITGKEKHMLSRKIRWEDPAERTKQSKRMMGVGNSWTPTPEQRLFPGILYLIRYLDESGTHFKLGITKRSLNERFKPHQLISIIHMHYATLGECFDLEQKLLKWAKDSGYRYSSSTTTELIHPAAIPLLLKNDSLNSLTSTEGMV
jgi:hypothetical protein